jgi:hypothetical protein
MTAVPITLPNGLKATLHPQRSKIVLELLKNCANRSEIFIKPYSLFALEVEVEDEHLYFLYWALFKPFDRMSTILRENFESTLQLNNYIIYNNIAYSLLNPANSALVTGVLQKIKPHIAIIINQ